MNGNVISKAHIVIIGTLYRAGNVKKQKLIESSALELINKMFPIAPN